MNFLRRLNIFWLGAGALLTLFCGNELVAFHLMKVRLWLGGPMIYVAMVLGLLLGLMVMAFLGVEARLEPGDLVPPAPTEGHGAGGVEGTPVATPEATPEAAPEATPEAAPGDAAPGPLALGGVHSREGLASGGRSTEAR